MASINNVPKTKFTNSEWLNFCLFIINYLNASNFSILKFESAFNLFKDKQKEFDGSLNKISKEQYWDRAKILKSQINNSRIGFYNLVNGETTSLIPETAAAADIILVLLKKYVKMGRMKYNDVIKSLSSLIQDCERDGNKAYIETLGLTKRVTGLNTLYNDALKLEEQLYNDEGINKRKRKASVTRVELYDAYEKLVKRLNALALIEGDTDYLELFAWWNAMIDRYRTVISARLGSGKGGKTDDGESSQHDPDSGSGNTGGEDDRPVIE